MGQRVGYKRVSSADQSTARQLEGEILDKVFEDFASGSTKLRPALDQMINYVREGDEVVVHSLDRLGRNLNDLLGITTLLTQKGVAVSFVLERLTMTGDDNSVARLTMHMMSAFAEFERNQIKQRQREGIELAKGRGVYKGRVQKLSKSQIAEIRILLSGGEEKAVVARKYGVSRTTLYNALRQN